MEAYLLFPSRQCMRHTLSSCVGKLLATSYKIPRLIVGAMRSASAPVLPFARAVARACVCMRIA